MIIQLSEQYEFISLFNDILDFISKVWFIIMILIILITFFLLNKMNTNKKSRKEYEKNENNKKYIKDIYIELSSCNEKLRYMFFSKEWVGRIRKEFKIIMNTNVGKMLARECNIKKYNYITYKGLYNSLLKCSECLKKSYHRKYDDENGERNNFLTYLDTNGFFIREDIYRLFENIEMIDNNVCFLMGNAGSGKTNLLTYFASVVDKNYKEQCIYINSKDVIDNDVESYFNSYFYNSITTGKNIIIKLLLLIKRFLNKKIIIIVEAINENSNTDFHKSLCYFLNKYYKNKNMMFIISSRVEFYNLKYKDIFDEYLDKKLKYKEIYIENLKVDINIYEKMYIKYKKYYNLKGHVSESVKRSLYKSQPIFMRIFFECYSDTNISIKEIDKSKLFSEYISRILKKYNVSEKLLDNIINQMIDNRNFNYIEKDKINMDYNEIDNFINENLLLTNSIIENESKVNERKVEIISITYDEIRDYLITNNIIERYENKKINIKKFIDEMINNRYVILEGVLKRLYYYFKENNDKICSYILSKKELEYGSYGSYDNYRNLLLEFIFTSDKDFIQAEKDYLNNAAIIYEEDIEKLIENCLFDLAYNVYPGCNFIKQHIDRYEEGDNSIFDNSVLTKDYCNKIIIKLKKLDNSYINEHVIKMLDEISEEER